MTEKKINELLLQTRRLADAIKDPKMSGAILNLGTLLFDQWALLHNYQPKKVFCPSCHEQLRKGIEVEWYSREGICLTCDTMREKYGGEPRLGEGEYEE